MLRWVAESASLLQRKVEAAVVLGAVGGVGAGNLCKAEMQEAVAFDVAGVFESDADTGEGA